MCGTLEYFTSFIMEKLFNARWWDYSKYKLNINGRICLEVVVLFAIAGICIVKLLNPTFLNVIQMIPKDVLNVFFYILSTIFLIDIIISLNIMTKIKNISKEVSKEFKDNTEEISSKIREILLEKSAPYRRILKAFPQAFADRVKTSREMIVQVASGIKNNVKDATERTVTKVNDIKEIATTNIKNIATNFSQPKSNQKNEKRLKVLKEKIKGFKLITIKKKDNKDSNDEK